jgi:hypothetical protein
MNNNVEVQSETLINVLITKVNNLTSENLVQASMIQELQLKIEKYQDQYPPMEIEENEEEIKIEE